MTKEDLLKQIAESGRERQDSAKKLTQKEQLTQTTEKMTKKA